MQNVTVSIQKEFSDSLGLYDGKKDEFLNKIIVDSQIKVIDDSIAPYNDNKYSPIDGLALKQCDKLSAFVEASLSISHGIKSKELINGKKQIIASLQKIEDVDFKEIAKEIDDAFGTSGTIQGKFEF